MAVNTPPAVAANDMDTHSNDEDEEMTTAVEYSESEDHEIL